MLMWQVYDLIDGSDGFFTNVIHPDYRSHTAIPFRLAACHSQCICSAINTDVLTLAVPHLVLYAVQALP